MEKGRQLVAFQAEMVDLWSPLLCCFVQGKPMCLVWAAVTSFLECISRTNEVESHY